MIIARIVIPLVINVDKGPVDLGQALQLAQLALGQLVALFHSHVFRQNDLHLNQKI